MRAYWTERKVKSGRVYSLRMGGVLLAQFHAPENEQFVTNELGPFASNGKAFFAGIDLRGPWVTERIYVRL